MHLHMQVRTCMLNHDIVQRYTIAKYMRRHNMHVYVEIEYRRAIYGHAE